MTISAVRVTEVTAGVIELVVDRPPLNILDSGTQGELTAALADLRQRDEVLALIVRGGGVRSLQRRGRHQGSRNHVRAGPVGWCTSRRALDYHPLDHAILDHRVCRRSVPRRGLELALCTDVRIASSGATFGFPEVRLGLIPGMGGTVRLPALVGRPWATRMVMTGQVIDAQRALQIGLVQDLADDPLSAALELAESLRGCGRLAQRTAKALVGRVADESLLKAEREGWLRLLDTGERREGTAAFREHRRPNFGG